VLDWGIPTEVPLAQLHARGAQYRVGAPKGRLTNVEQRLLALPRQAARPNGAGHASGLVQVSRMNTFWSLPVSSEGGHQSVVHPLTSASRG
jgi:hypothetical protein